MAPHQDGESSWWHQNVADAQKIKRHKHNRFEALDGDSQDLFGIVQIGGGRQFPADLFRLGGSRNLLFSRRSLKDSSSGSRGRRTPAPLKPNSKFTPVSLCHRHQGFFVNVKLCTRLTPTKRRVSHLLRPRCPPPQPDPGGASLPVYQLCHLVRQRFKFGV